MKKNVIVIVGPTAVGKTKLSIEIAKQINGEIISGDSMQVYEGMDIGTAKVTQVEMQGIPHYMIDTRQVDEVFSVADFQKEVQEHIETISADQKTPIIVGGSGLYIQATLYNYNFSEQKRDDALTSKLEKIVEEQGITPVYERLKLVDPEQAAKIHPNNHRRVIRALEIYEMTGSTMSDYHASQDKESPYNIIFIGLEMDREDLYEQINERVDTMLTNGLIDEVKGLYDRGLKDCQSMKAIGYKEFIPYFEGEQTLEQSVELLKRNSRRFAKRQYTWFKNKLAMDWYTVTPETSSEVFSSITNKIAGILDIK